MAETLGRRPVAQDQLADRPGRGPRRLERLGDRPRTTARRSVTRHAGRRAGCAPTQRLGRSGGDEDAHRGARLVLDEPDRHRAGQPGAFTASLDPDEPPGRDEVVLHRDHDRWAPARRPSGGLGPSRTVRAIRMDPGDRTARRSRTARSGWPAETDRASGRGRGVEAGLADGAPPKRRVPTRPVLMAQPTAARGSARASSRHRRCVEGSNDRRQRPATRTAAMRGPRRVRGPAMDRSGHRAQRLRCQDLPSVWVDGA